MEKHGRATRRSRKIGAATNSRVYAVALLLNFVINPEDAEAQSMDVASTSPYAFPSPVARVGQRRYSKGDGGYLRHLGEARGALGNTRECWGV